MKESAFEVVIPAMNAEISVGAAVESAFLSGASGVTVVDDGSTDGTASVASAAGARVISQTNAGPSAARKEGLKSVRATLVCLLDADDRLCSDGVRSARYMLDQNLLVQAVVGRYRYSLNGALRSVAALGYEGLTTGDLVVQGHGPAPPSAIIYRTAIVRRAFSPEAGEWSGAGLAEDYELLIRVAHLGQVVGSNEVTCVYSFGSGRSFDQRRIELRDRRLVQHHYSRLYGIKVPDWPMRRDRSVALLAEARLAGLRGNRTRFGLYTCAAIAFDPALIVRALRRRAAACRVDRLARE